MLEFLGSFSASPDPHTLRYSELGIQFGVGRTNNLSKMRPVWLKKYATSGKPKAVTNLGLKAFINRLIQSYRDDPFWASPYTPILEREIGDFVERCYPNMPSNRVGNLPARRKRALPVKDEPKEVAFLPITVAEGLPIKREETEEERASRLRFKRRRGGTSASSSSTRGGSGSSGRREGGPFSSTTTTTTAGSEEVEVDKPADFTTNSKGPEEANVADSVISSKDPEEATVDKLADSAANKLDEPAVNNLEASDVEKLDESTGSGMFCEEQSLEIVTARSKKDQGGVNIGLMLGQAITYLETKSVVARPLTKVEVNRAGSCLPDTLVALTDLGVDQNTLAEKSGIVRKAAVNRFLGAIKTATEEQLEKLLKLATPKAGEAAPKNREELMALVASYGEEDKYAGEGGDIFVLLCAYHLGRSILVVDIHADRPSKTHVIYHDLIFVDKAGTSNLSPLLVVRKGDHFEPLLVDNDQKANLWGLFTEHRQEDFPTEEELAEVKRREELKNKEDEEMRLAMAQSMETTEAPRVDPVQGGGDELMEGAEELGDDAQVGQKGDPVQAGDDGPHDPAPSGLQQDVAEAPLAPEVTPHGNKAHRGPFGCPRSELINTSIIGGVLVCDFCGFSSRSKLRALLMMKDHHKNLHSVVGALSCDHCSVIVTKIGTLKKHKSYCHAS